METRETKHFENLSEKIANIEAKKYASDCYQAYDLIHPKKRLVGKAHT